MLPSGAAAKAAVQDFTAGAIYPVLVTSYETLRLVADQLAGRCDLLICDEGHRCSALRIRVLGMTVATRGPSGPSACALVCFPLTVDDTCASVSPP